MELTFLGRGAAFNPKEGNTSAYFIENNELFLIDCGETVFERLIESGILETIDTINLMITHTHSDHIGSLGTLVMYSYFSLKKPLNIIAKGTEEFFTNLNSIINGFGITKDMYTFADEKSLDNKLNSFFKLRYIETKHYDGLNCYGIIFYTTNGIVYYSGDTRELEQIKILISNPNLIDKIYVDVSSADFPGNPHVYIGNLSKEIPLELKSKIYCMHFNNDLCIEQAKENGFNVVEVQKNPQKIFNKS